MQAALKQKAESLQQQALALQEETKIKDAALKKLELEKEEARKKLELEKEKARAQMEAKLKEKDDEVRRLTLQAQQHAHEEEARKQALALEEEKKGREQALEAQRIALEEETKLQEEAQKKLELEKEEAQKKLELEKEEALKKKLELEKEEALKKKLELEKEKARAQMEARLKEKDDEVQLEKEEARKKLELEKEEARNKLNLEKEEAQAQMEARLKEKDDEVRRLTLQARQHAREEEARKQAEQENQSAMAARIAELQSEHALTKNELTKQHQQVTHKMQEELMGSKEEIERLSKSKEELSLLGEEARRTLADEARKAMERYAELTRRNRHVEDQVKMLMDRQHETDKELKHAQKDVETLRVSEAHLSSASEDERAKYRGLLADAQNKVQVLQDWKRGVCQNLEDYLDKALEVLDDGLFANVVEQAFESTRDGIKTRAKTLKGVLGNVDSAHVENAWRDVMTLQIDISSLNNDIRREADQGILQLHATKLTLEKEMRELSTKNTQLEKELVTTKGSSETAQSDLRRRLEETKRKLEEAEAKQFQMDDLKNAIAEMGRGIQRIESKVESLGFQSEELSKKLEASTASLLEPILTAINESWEVQCPTSFVLLPFKFSHKEPNLADMKAWLETFGDLSVACNEEEASARSATTPTASNFMERVSSSLKKVEACKAKLVERYVSTSYLYLLDEVTGEILCGDNYPIHIEDPTEVVKKYLPLMRLGVNAVCAFNKLAAVGHLFGVPVPEIPGCLTSSAKQFIEKASSEKCGVLQENERHGVRGQDLRELQALLIERDPVGGFCGLRRVFDNRDKLTGKMIWTTKEGVKDLEREYGSRARAPTRDQVPEHSCNTEFSAINPLVPNNEGLRMEESTVPNELYRVLEELGIVRCAHLLAEERVQVNKRFVVFLIFTAFILMYFPRFFLCRASKI
jgi:hypothetical protein